MYSIVASVTDTLAIFTVFGNVLAIALIALYLFTKFKKKEIKLSQLLSKHGVLFAWFVSFSAMAASLFYSEYAKYPPCELCWIQRIFFYPQVLILGIAMYKKDKNVTRYALPMAIIGLLVAIYQYIAQMLTAAGNTIIDSFVPCGASGAPSCTEFYFLKFGYITIPLMSLTGFVLITMLLLFAHKNATKK
ncbi:disulfide bond formation protein B [Candidatus Peregrinibacteria bacterium CG_4_9_14_0_2_um_filter_41_14]|nr:MAG: disulfide bond formation protein B [Candidatus Peregrinibacteria bacterium CG_4_9_14_0_2_um_filter_41_14]